MDAKASGKLITPYRGFGIKQSKTFASKSETDVKATCNFKLEVKSG